MTRYRPSTGRAGAAITSSSRTNWRPTCPRSSCTSGANRSRSTAISRASRRHPSSRNSGIPGSIRYDTARACPERAASERGRMRTIASILLIFALAACTKVGTTGSEGAGGGQHPYTIAHELRYATAEDIVGLNPHLGTQTVVSYLAQLTMAWLLRTGPHNEPVPELATEVPSKENGGISRDGLTITYHLRKGVVWSDGVPFTADDVVFSTNVVLNPANNEISRTGWDLITKIDEPDKYTVVYHLMRPYAGYDYTYF